MGDLEKYLTQEQKDDFHKKMILQADDFAIMSKDRSTKVGAGLLKLSQRHPGGWGYNGMVRGANDFLLYRHGRPEKYLWTEHAERNLIFNEARKTCEGKMMFCNKFPDIVEARAIASVGIKQVITTWPQKYEDSYEMSVNKADVESLKITADEKNYARVNQIFKENDIHLVLVNLKKNENILDTEGINFTKMDLDRYHKYQEYLIIVDRYAKRWCPDEVSDKRAALILDIQSYTPIAWGVHDMPTRFKFIATKEEKNNPKFYIPAACNAIYTTVKTSLEGSSLYASWCPCLDCSMAAAEAGVENVFSKEPDFTREEDLRWKDMFEASIFFYNRIGMNYKLYPYADLDEIKKKENL